MKLYCIILISLALASCNRHAIKSRTVESRQAHYTASFTDTSKEATTETTTSTIHFGDTLSGSLYFPELPGCNQNPNLSDTTGFVPVVEDSLESAGIKIKVGIIPYKGGFKTRIKAVSKPVSVVNTTQKNQQKETGVSVLHDSLIVATSNVRHSDTQTSNWGWIVIAALLFTTLFFIAKEYINGKKK